MSGHFQIIESKLKQHFSPVHLELLNESHMHSVPANSETHFKVILVSNDFERLPPVKRHQAVYGVLQQELSSGVHALALHLYTPNQWLERQGAAPMSPECAGSRKSNV
ncbi:BolA family protein [Teredinibacter franksiae]|uniref:BolA family protein n=1 Tax=Teredinibacter franksiae TaxID=2761453 RepID=UPI001625DA45|nr:BolA/IbaG family iron-sulfur metabolism protein [Teredinibacter franksiae]